MKKSITLALSDEGLIERCRILQDEDEKGGLTTGVFCARLLVCDILCETLAAKLRQRVSERGSNVVEG